jgi:hypothetical protein
MVALQNEAMKTCLLKNIGLFVARDKSYIFLGANALAFCAPQRMFDLCGVPDAVALLGRFLPIKLRPRLAWGDFFCAGGKAGRTWRV